MNKKYSRVIALLMAVFMAFSLTGCTSDNVYLTFLFEGWDGIVDGEVVWENGSGKEVTDEEGTTGEETTAEGEEATDESGEVVVEEVVTDESGETVTKKDGTPVKTTKKVSKTQSGVKKPGSTASNSSKPGSTASKKPTGGTQTPATTLPAKTSYTTAEALDLYKTAANKIKTMADGAVTCTRTREVYTEVGEKNLSGLSGTIISKAFAPKDDKSQKVLSSKSDIAKSFVVEKQSYVCALTTSDIKSASAKTSGNNVIVTIYVKDDTSGQNYSNKAVSATAVADLAETFSSGLNMSCKNVRVTATIDANGRLVSLNTYMPSYFSKDDQKFGAAIEQWWSISYK